MLTYADRVQEITSTIGTGTITLGGAVTGFQTFTSALSTGALVTYCIQDGAAWEVGQGVFTTSGLTLTRVLIASSTGSLLSLDGAATVFLTTAARDVNQIGSDPLRATGVLAETVPRWLFMQGDATVLTNGVLWLSLIYLPAGITVTNLSFSNQGTAYVHGTSAHFWFALFDASRHLLGQSPDDTAGTMATFTVTTKALATPIVTAYSGLYYVGIMMAAASGLTIPTIVTAASGANAQGQPPILAGSSTTGLGATAPSTAAAITGDYRILYAYVS